LDASLKRFRYVGGPRTNVFRNIQTLKDVVDFDLCTGCGACHYNCDKGAVELVNIQNVGIRPKFTSEGCAGCTKCLSICPGYQIDGQLATGALQSGKFSSEIGEVLEIWEGHASHPEVRYRGSSGGVLSALALYCLENEGMDRVVHSGKSKDEPWINTTQVSVNREQILSHTGSRYAPSSPCDGLEKIECGDGPSVFIGKPCDAAAVGMLRTEREELDRNLGLVLTFFCAGTPSTQGTLDLIDSLGVDRDNVRSVRYRGEGWPGEFRILPDDHSHEQRLTYAESWDRLTGYRPLRCNLCPDGLGRVADISCGDAWHKYSNEGDPGRSIVLVRTKRGQEILRRAIAAKYVELTPVGGEAVLAAQTSLLNRRRELFGRLLAMRLLMIPTPRFLNLSLLESWLRLPLLVQFKTVSGTLRRALTRGWWRRRRLAFDAAQMKREKKREGALV
jgi:coenzyme F420 hydrogenase subunit beta